MTIQYEELGDVELTGEDAERAARQILQAECDLASTAKAGRETDRKIHRLVCKRQAGSEWTYSSTIASVWPLAEQFRVSVGPWAGAPGGWIAIVHSSTHHPIASALAPKAPLAICRALLVAHARGLLPRD